MPRFQLEQVDGGQPIDLPCGDTLIGRGPFLGVNDKRVSRNHGILENVDGQLRLKPTHLNPCFVQTSLEAPPEPLEKDKWHNLKEGSIFSLLPGKYIYRVHFITEESTLGKRQSYDEEPQTEPEKSKPPRVNEETLEYSLQAKSGVSLTPDSTLTGQSEALHKPDPSSCSQVVRAVLSSTAESAPLTPQKKRVLPAWMTAATPAAQSPPVVKAAAKRTPAQATPKVRQSKQAVGPKRTRIKQRSSGDEEDDDEEHSEVAQKPRKRARKLNSDTEESQDQAPGTEPSRERSLEGRLSEDSEREEVEERRKGGKRAGSTPRPRAAGSTTDIESEKRPLQNRQQGQKASTSKINSSTSKPEVQPRTPCPYGTSCYRKNPIHFQECSHPGDDDYTEEQRNDIKDDDDDDRPECPYGTDCYRKNPLHKKEYKHTQPPANNSVPDDEDEDRYEDSFINDVSEEEEMDEGSDYVPESDDSGKEDIKVLQKEAKAFLRRKK